MMLRKTFLLVLLAATPAFAQNMKFGLDGRSWRAVDSVSKLVLIHGIYDGIVYSSGALASKYSYDTSWDTLVVRLNVLYRDSANLPVPVALALQVVSLQLKGTPPPVVDRELRRLRCRVAIVSANLPREEDRKALDACDSMS